MSPLTAKPIYFAKPEVSIAMAKLKPPPNRIKIFQGMAFMFCQFTILRPGSVPAGRMNKTRQDVIAIPASDKPGKSSDAKGLNIQNIAVSPNTMATRFSGVVI